MDEFIATCLTDVLNACNQVEAFFGDSPRRYDDFVRNDLLRSGVERKVEIMGEAINRILKHSPDFQLANAKAIINTRNRVIHAYDNVTPEFLWTLVMRHIPALKQDVEQMLDEYECAIDNKEEA